VEPRFLIIETSQRCGWAAIAQGERAIAQARLDEARRHARDLAPCAARLLADQGWTARDLSGVMVSRGPGSYTGLRVGIMSAKTLAYAAGCALVAVDTFAALALQAPRDALAVEVVADAQQDQLYVQRFQRAASAEPWTANSDLAVAPMCEWLTTLSPGAWVTGPGLEGQLHRLPPGTAVTPQADWQPRPASLLELGLERWRRGERDDPFALEPLYLRPSAAERQWQS
jgi:tRNA threonylcarbamoyladenosine biosynthesis protein TsaB